MLCSDFRTTLREPSTISDVRRQILRLMLMLFCCSSTYVLWVCVGLDLSLPLRLHVCDFCCVCVSFFFCVCAFVFVCVYVYVWLSVLVCVWAGPFLSWRSSKLGLRTPSWGLKQRPQQQQSLSRDGRACCACNTWLSSGWLLGLGLQLFRFV